MTLRAALRPPLRGESAERVRPRAVAWTGEHCGPTLLRLLPAIGRWFGGDRMFVLPKSVVTIASRIVAGGAGLALLVGCGGGGSSQGARTWTFGLGDLSAETAYLDTKGGGAITEYSDPAAPEATVLYLD